MLFTILVVTTLADAVWKSLRDIRSMFSLNILRSLSSATLKYSHQRRPSVSC